MALFRFAFVVLLLAINALARPLCFGR